MAPLTLSEVNVNETEGMPEKARNGYAALSTFMSTKLGMERKRCSTAVALNLCNTDKIENVLTDHN